MNRRGFTIIELIITITIMALLIVLSFVNLDSSQINSRDAERKADIEAIAIHLDNFYNVGSDTSTTTGRYPSTVLTQNGASSQVVQALVVGGGGGGGNAGSGGGGGGVVYNASVPILTQAYPITVGAGGAGGVGDGVAGGTGGSSIFSTITANGGGGGVSRNNCAGGNGASSGGGPISTSCTATGGIASQGYAGGNGYLEGSLTGNSGGGGGAGGAGVAGGNTAGSGAGGVGLANSITGTSTYYAGGGGGGEYNGSYVGAGGLGGGGNAVMSDVGGNGTANTGGGGAGGSYNGLNLNGGDGGSGIVIIAYPSSLLTATGGTKTTFGNMTVHIFTTSGTFTVNNMSATGNTQKMLNNIDIKSITAPGVTDITQTFIPATNNVQTTSGVLPQPTINQYIYQPLQSDGTLCTSEYQECRKFNLYYRTEADNVVHMVVSKNQ